MTCHPSSGTRELGWKYGGCSSWQPTHGPLLIQMFGRSQSKSACSSPGCGITTFRAQLADMADCQSTFKSTRKLVFSVKAPKYTKMLIFGGILSTQGRLSPPPLPNPAKKVLFGKIALKTFFFLHLSARAWTRIGLRMTKKHKNDPFSGFCDVYSWTDPYHTWACPV